MIVVSTIVVVEVTYAISRVNNDNGINKKISASGNESTGVSSIESSSGATNL